MMVQADHGVALARAAELFIELGQHFDGDVAAGLLGHHAVEQHDAPRADVGGAIEHERAGRERFAHLRDEIVVARNAQHGLAEARKDPAEVFVAGRVVLHEIAGDEDCVADGQVARRVGKRTFEGFEGIHTAQGARGIAEQMGIRELDDSDCTHSIELYKQAGSRRVMRVTGLFMALRRGEPGRNLRAEKCEAQSVYSDLPKVKPLPKQW